MDKKSTASERGSQRRARTRAALIDAAQKLIAEGRSTGASIQEITGRAAVGFGSFYNHFESKADLFDHAVLDMVDALGARIDRGTRDIEDPAEVVAARLRLTGRLQREFPDAARVVLNGGPRYLMSDAGLAPGTRRDIEAAIANGQLTVIDTEIAVATVTGVLLGMAQLLNDDPTRDAAVSSDRVAERLLIGMGVPAAHAADLVSRPLPECA